MTAYIDRIITEVVVDSEPDAGGDPSDKRWEQKQKIVAVIKSQDTSAERLRAEGLDD